MLEDWHGLSSTSGGIDAGGTSASLVVDILSAFSSHSAVCSTTSASVAASCDEVATPGVSDTFRSVQQSVRKYIFYNLHATNSNVKTAIFHDGLLNSSLALFGQIRIQIFPKMDVQNMFIASLDLMFKLLFALKI